MSWHFGKPCSFPCRAFGLLLVVAPVLTFHNTVLASERPFDEPHSSKAPTDSVSKASIGMWGRPIERGGFHFQIEFGIGGGPDTLGLFHGMELGYSWDQSTIGLLHTFIQNKGVLESDLGGPDLIGGWMLEYKHTLWVPDLEWKLAVGIGGTHDQSDGIEAHGGFGASYGIDWHYPVTRRFGPTLTLAAMHVTAEGQHHFGVGLGLGVTVF
jgi:hypothetical protein